MRAQIRYNQGYKRGRGIGNEKFCMEHSALLGVAKYGSFPNMLPVLHNQQKIVYLLVPNTGVCNIVW